MEIEFNGISETELSSVCKNLGLEADVLELKRRYLVCENEEIRDFGEGEIAPYIYDNCWYEFFYCTSYQNRNSPKHSPKKNGESTRGSFEARGRASTGTSACMCGDYSKDDCSKTNDSLGAILMFIMIVASVLFVMWVLPFLVPIFVGLVNIGLALMLGLFNVITFGTLRNKFKRVLLYLPQDPDRETLDKLLSEVATLGGLPRRFVPSFKYGYYTNGFFLLRSGAYLFIPALIGTGLVLWIQPESNFILFAPILSFVLSIFLILLGNVLISRKAREISRTS